MEHTNIYIYKYIYKYINMDKHNVIYNTHAMYTHHTHTHYTQHRLAHTSSVSSSLSTVGSFWLGSLTVDLYRGEGDGRGRRGTSSLNQKEQTHARTHARTHAPTHARTHTHPDTHTHWKWVNL